MTCSIYAKVAWSHNENSDVLADQVCTHLSEKYETLSAQDCSSPIKYDRSPRCRLFLLLAICT